MLDTGDESPRLTMVFLPAMLCDEELYHPQIGGLRDLVKPVGLTVAEPTMAEAANAVLRQAPRRFLLAGTSYGGKSRAGGRRQGAGARFGALADGMQSGASYRSGCRAPAQRPRTTGGISTTS